MVHGNQNGSTLIEVIVAMLMLSVLVVGLNAGVVTLIKSNVNSRELTSATTVGNQLFENFRRGSYDAMIAAGSSADTVRSRYVRRWMITSANSQAKIDVTVNWPKETQKHYIKLSTIIARP